MTSCRLESCRLESYRLESYRLESYRLLTLKPNNLPYFGRQRRTTTQPWPFGHATRTTLAFRPRYANNIQQHNLGLSATLREQPWPFGHATRTTFNNTTFNNTTLNNICLESCQL
ncbi:hypothetical protein [Moorena sp. SIO3E8]|uniref:hypothetical protein n=1 Tax=Moorena sp. SIO3E8 TaxID=2607830 RepID=UPI001418EEEA|nr:hypothetical protein [Moorena sp. SIO3E8]NEO15451.1 hypothetical protein [Moorena sp. SIO3E8]